MKYFLLTLALLLPAAAFAQESTQFVPLTGLPGLDSLTNAGGASSLSGFFNALYRVCIGAAAVIAVLNIMYAGSQSILQEGSVIEKGKVRTRITNSILGLVLVLSPAIVFSIIDPRILDLDIGNISELRLKPSTGNESGTGNEGQNQGSQGENGSNGQQGEAGQEECPAGQQEVFDGDETLDCEPIPPENEGEEVTGSVSFSVNNEGNAAFVYYMPAIAGNGDRCNFYVVNDYSAQATMSQSADANALQQCNANISRRPNNSTVALQCTTNDRLNFTVPQPACNQPGIVNN